MNDSPAYPSRWPKFRLIGMALSLGALAWFVLLWRNHVTTVERYDMFSFVRTSIPEFPFAKKYTVVMHGTALAVPSDRDGLTLGTIPFNHDRLGAWLETHVYGGSLWWALKWPLTGFGFVLVLLVGAGGYLDRRFNADARDGRILRGPRLISKWRWNWESRGKKGFYIETR